MTITRRHICSLLPGALLPRTAPAQADKRLTILVGYPAGGAPDTVGRALAEGLRKQGYTAVVENKAGAGGRIAIDALLKAPADGQTLLLMPSSNVVIYPHIYNNLRYRNTDFAFLASVAEYSFGLAVSASVPANNLNDFLAWAKTHPNQAAFGTPGAGSAMHFLGMQLASQAKFAYQHVPYKGGAPALADAIGGSISSLITTFPNLIKAHQANKVRILAQTGETRDSTVPDIPTFKELGYPGLTMVDRFMFAANAKVPANKQRELGQALLAAAEDPAVRKMLEAAEYTPVAVKQDTLTPRINQEFDRWGQIVKATGYKAED